MIREYFEDIDKRREEIIKKGRDLIKEATRAIVSASRGEFEEAEKHLENARKIKKELENLFSEDMYIYAGSSFITAIQEYVEAEQFISLLKDKKIKSPEELKVGYLPWILGTFDAIGEISRKIYDLLLEGKDDEAIFYIKFMEDFYNQTAELSVYKFVNGLRQRIDWTRKKIEEFKRIILTRK